MEFGVNQYDEEKQTVIYLGIFKIRLPIIVSKHGIERTIKFSRRGFDVTKNDITRCYYWKDVFKRS